MQIKLIPIFGIVILIITTGWYLTNNNFKYKLDLCNKATGECEMIATFKELDTCQAINKRWNWKCSDTDKNDIQCVVGQGVLAESTCKAK